jgi:flavorubredoxin
MKATEIYNEEHQWIVFGRDPLKTDKIIDTNQCMVMSGGKALLIDPGGIELFSSMLASVLKFVSLEQITDLFASHQDPDIISSLGLWDQVLKGATLHSPWIWEGFIRHFGMNQITYAPIPDKGGMLRLGGLDLELIPAHYLHSSGNFNLYDAQARILFSGDIGASLEANDVPMYISDFDDHIQHIELFHRRWMPSNRVKNQWIKRVRALEIDIMIPQHGRIYRGEQVQRFLDWFEALEVGVAM